MQHRQHSMVHMTRSPICSTTSSGGGQSEASSIGGGRYNEASCSASIGKETSGDREG